jgi:hypothetical protein
MRTRHARCAIHAEGDSKLNTTAIVVIVSPRVRMDFADATDAQRAAAFDETRRTADGLGARRDEAVGRNAW